VAHLKAMYQSILRTSAYLGISVTWSEIRAQVPQTQFKLIFRSKERMCQHGCDHPIEGVGAIYVSMFKCRRFHLKLQIVPRDAVACPGVLCSAARSYLCLP
jgi:hypothetical protein